MKTINIEGVQLSEESLAILREWQEDGNAAFSLIADLFDTAVYHLSNPDAGMTDTQRLYLVAGMLDFKRILSNFKMKEGGHGQK